MFRKPKSFLMIIARVSFFICILVLTACESQPSSTSLATTAPNVQNSKPDQVLFTLDWAIFGRHAPYFVALDKGYYAEENISITIVRGYSSTDSITQVAAGRSQFSFADMGTLVLARGNDPSVRVKSVAVIYAKAPHLFFCNADLGIKTPKDLEGHTIGAPAGNSHRVLFPVFAQINKIDPAKVNWQTIDATLQMSSLFAKNIDCMPEYFTSLLEKKATETNYKFNIIRYSEYGMNFYSNSLMANEDMMNKNPELIRRFVRATLKGFQYSFNHPDEAIDILLKYHSEIDDKSVALQEVKSVHELAISDEAKLKGLGYMDSAKVKATIDLISGAYQLKSQVQPNDIYSNDFLPKAP